jgi:tetratricopeptide (TPR) repeat protein
MPLLRLVRIVSVAALAALLLPAPARAQASAEAQLAQARTQFETLNFEAAASTLDPLIAQLESQAAKDMVAARMLPTAYELRARSRYQLGNTEGATGDFRSLLRVAPGYALSGQVSQRIARTFEDIRKASVGKMLLNLTPADADLELDGLPFTQAAGEIPIAVGSHTLSGRRSGCRSASQSFTVMPAATTEVVLTLERVSASLALVTSPLAVEIVVDGVSRGRTEGGSLTPQWTESVAKLNLPANLVSKPFVIDDLGQGSHTVEFLKDCHTKVERRVVVDKPADFLLDPVKLEKAVASIYVDSTATGAAVLLDGESRGPAPQSLDDVCEGSHVIELRSPWGRYVERTTTHAGDKLNIQGTVRPAVGLLSVTGLPDGYRGTDSRLALERGFAASKAVTLFGPPLEKVQQALKAESLSQGWLAFDRWRRPMGTNASAITPAARMEIAGRLAKALEVQGVAELTARPGTDRAQFLLSILAAGSSEPDVLEVNLDSPASINGVIAQLDRLPAMYRPSAGLSVADVTDVAGAVVVGVDVDGGAAKAGLSPGDIITKLDGQPVADGSAFSSAVAQHKANDTLTVEVKDRNGASKGASLVIAMAPRLIAMNDQSLLFNNLVLTLRPRLALSAGTTPDPIVRLNLAVALMRLGNWTEARTELAKIQLAAGPGVSNGTVQYLLGLCHEALGQVADAEKAWRAAATDSESQLTEDGPAVKELAERKLAGARKM